MSNTGHLELLDRQLDRASREMIFLRQILNMPKQRGYSIQIIQMSMWYVCSPWYANE